MRLIGLRVREFISHLRWNNPYLWAIVLRLVLLCAFRTNPRGDAAEFHTIAMNIATGHGFSRCGEPPFPPTAQRPPLYPVLLSLFYALKINGFYVPGLINLAFDLITMKVSERLARVIKMPHAHVFPWIIALCPMLITFGAQPLTENLSVLLFFLATLHLFSTHWRRAGFLFGLLSLCRSYAILLPPFLATVKPSPKFPRKALLVATLFGFAAPSLWVARNLITFQKPIFSQTGTAAFQSYVGLCRRNFDWWDPADVEHVMTVPLFRDIIYSQCRTDADVYSLNSRIRGEITNCIREAPERVLANVAVKSWNLFVDWGEIFPYDFVPRSERMIIDLALLLIWARIIWIWVALRKRDPDQFRLGPLADLFRYSALNIAYVFFVTIPFGIDARYLLGPSIFAFGVTLQALPDPIDFVREPLVQIFGKETSSEMPS